MTDASQSPHPIDVQVGHRIASLRQARGFNQADVGAAIGVTFQQVQKYEKGTNRVSASKLALIADLFAVGIQDLFPAKEHWTSVSQVPIDQLAGTAEGRELARLFVTMPAERRAALVTVARAIAGPTATELARDLETE